MRYGLVAESTDLLRNVVFGAAAFFVLFPGASPAQTGRTLAGQAVSPSPNGETYAVPGATVKLLSVEAATDADAPTAQSDHLGVFRFSDVADGCYLLTAESEVLSGQTDIVCIPRPDGAEPLTISMRVTAVVETIDVTAAAIDINPTETSSTESIGNATLQNAPKRNRSYDDTLPLIPGVVRGPSGELNLNGARAGQGSAQLNGVDVTDPVVRTTQINLPIDAVSNVNVLSSPYDAQYGGFAGAVSTIQTKPSNFDEYKVNVQNFTPRLRKRGGSIVGIESSTPRATVTGPIKKGKLAFLHSTEYQFVRNQQEDANLPPLERDIEREALSVFTQLDAQHTEKNSTVANILFFPEKLNFFGLDAFTPQPATPDLRRRGRLLSARNTQQFDSGALLLSNLSWQRLENDVRANSLAPSVIGIERASGGFFNKQNRETERVRWAEQYSFRPLQRWGGHQLKTGFDLGRQNYDGRQVFDPVTWLGVDGEPVLDAIFGPDVSVDARKTDFAAFLQDKWSPTASLTLDLGLRVERDSIAGEMNPSYRAGFAYSLPGSKRTVVRGGTGLFYDRLSLFVPIFTAMPGRTYRTFGAGGALLSELAFQHRLDGPIKNPRSFGWSLQVDQEVLSNVFLRLGYQQRRTNRNLLIGRELGPTSYLTLGNNGRDSYREYQATVRYRIHGASHLTASYVRSSAVGDLNDVGSIYGAAPAALIRGNERAPLDFDAPNRFLTWADLELPWGFRAAPVLELRQGFPYSNVNEYREFVGPRHRAGRFPLFKTFDLQLTKTFKFPVGDKRPIVRAGVRLFNLLNQFNPVDVQNNLASPYYGTFYRGVDRKVRAVFEIGN